MQVSISLQRRRPLEADSDLTHWLFGRDIPAPKLAKFRETIRQRLLPNA